MLEKYHLPFPGAENQLVSKRLSVSLCDRILLMCHLMIPR